MRQFIPLESSSFKLRAGRHTLIDASLQLLRLMLVATLLVMLAWSALHHTAALHETNTVQLRSENKVALAAAPVNAWSDHDARA